MASLLLMVMVPCRPLSGSGGALRCQVGEEASRLANESSGDAVGRVCSTRALRWQPFSRAYFFPQSDGQGAFCEASIKRGDVAVGVPFARRRKLERLARCARAEAARQRRRGRSTSPRTRALSSPRARTRSSSPRRCAGTCARASRCKPSFSSALCCRGRPASSTTPSRSLSRSRPTERSRRRHLSLSAPRSTRARSSPASLPPTSSCAPRWSRPTPRQAARTSRAPHSTRRRAGISTTMLHGHATRGEVAMAREIFDGTQQRDAFSWSSMMSAYAKGRQSKEALDLWRDMRTACVAPDCITMVSVLSACSDMGALAVGREVHQFVESNGVEVDVKLGTALIDMYAKCGDIENSLNVFHSMEEKDVLTWSSMIIGLANHGLGHDALSMFSKMTSEGLKPNEITFIGVLIACTHLGLVSDGKKYFSSMTEVYGVAPRVEHYGCMVDLLGRSGHIQEARQLIRDMPFEPDAVIWRALLGACRIHKNIEVAEEAMSKLRVLDPHADGHYVLLSNIYAQANSWEGVAEMRKTLRRENIPRIPGRSSIEWQNTIHEFVSGDRSHPRTEEIYEMLEEMMNRLRQAGHKPMTSLVLQDIDEQAKERALAEHSEKLALAFGLLTTPARSTLRITKNLRACEDCHSAFKFISLVYGRKLIVRDRNRFHHFDQGHCSCKDYW